MIRKERGRIMRVRTRHSDRVGRRSWIPFKQWERDVSRMLFLIESLSDEPGHHISPPHPSFPSNKRVQCAFLPPSSPFQTLFSLSLRLSLAVGQWACVRAMTGDQTRAVSVCQRVWTRFLCVSVWNNKSGCVRELVSKGFYALLRKMCVCSALRV